MSSQVNHTKQLSVTESLTTGLYNLGLPVHGDNRGWFKEKVEAKYAEQGQ